MDNEQPTAIRHNYQLSTINYQLFGHILQHLIALEKRLEALEKEK